MKKLALFISLVAIVAMSACEKENVTPDKSFGDYENYVYYPDLGGYVLDNDQLHGRLYVMNQSDLGPYLSTDIPTSFSIEGFTDWYVPDPQKAGSIASIFDRADDNMKVTPGGWYWFYHNGTPELVKMQENDETKLDDGNSHPLRVIRYIEYEPTEHLPQ